MRCTRLGMRGAGNTHCTLALTRWWGSCLHWVAMTAGTPTTSCEGSRICSCRSPEGGSAGRPSLPELEPAGHGQTGTNTRHKPLQPAATRTDRYKHPTQVCSSLLGHGQTGHKRPTQACSSLPPHGETVTNTPQKSAPTNRGHFPAATTKLTANQQLFEHTCPIKCAGG